MKAFIKKILKSIKKKICIYKYKKYKKKCKKNKQTEFLIFNTPIHGNIGDHAIIYAEYKMLEKENIKAFEIPTFQEKYYFDYIKNNISKDAMVGITGGGFIGSQWMIEEDLVNKVVETFEEHKIIIFPATIFFKEDEFGKKELEKSIKIFNNAKNLNIFARENKTYEFAKKTYQNANVILIPDIVLTLENQNLNCERKGILLCLRRDVEGIFSQKDKKELYSIINKYDTNIKYIDTVVNYSIKPKNRKKEIEKKLKEFSSSKLVITDRLHGMIFATITNTPCIVLGNYNYKVKGVYDNWIKDNVNNIIFVEDINQIQPNIIKLKNIKNDNTIKFNFKELINILEENING